jgi:hypothetical protein
MKKILRLGVYAYKEIRDGTPLGKALRELYKKRRKKNKERTAERNETATGK